MIAQNQPEVALIKYTKDQKPASKCTVYSWMGASDVATLWCKPTGQLRVTEGPGTSLDIGTTLDGTGRFVRALCPSAEVRDAWSGAFTQHHLTD